LFPVFTVDWSKAEAEANGEKCFVTASPTGHASGARVAAHSTTLSAGFGPERYDQAPPEVRRRIEASEARTQELLPIAVRLWVPILTGTDVVGTLPGEVAQLTRPGLNPADAIAAATSWAYRFLRMVPNEPGMLATFVTYQEDPLSDPRVLESPAAVVIAGVRVR